MKDYILNYFTNNAGNLKSIKDAKIIDFLNSIFPEVQHKSNNYTLKVKATMVLLDLTEEPTCITCKNPVDLLPVDYKFSPKERRTQFFSWKPYCCQTCAYNSNLVVENRKKTTKERYGADSWAKSEVAKLTSTLPWDQTTKDKYNTSYKATSQKRYGVDHFSSTKEYLEKRTETSIARYGVANTFQLTDKIKSTNIDRYGVEHLNQTEENRIKFSINNPMKNETSKRKSSLNRMLTTIKDDTLRYCLINDDRAKLKEYLDSFNCNSRSELSKLLLLSHSYLNNLLRRFDMRELYLDVSVSNAEMEIFKYIQSLYSGTILLNDRSTIQNGRELDIYLPELNLAIEFDGIYYHSEGAFGKDATYHLSKTQDCEKLGIQLLHIFENEWSDIVKKEIWKSIIKNKLKLSGNRYYARKCTVKEIDSGTSREFLDRTHLAGFIGATTHLGMFHDNELVSVLSYGNSRFEDKLEIIRYASKLNSNIIGGFGKFYKLLPSDIITYADRRYSSPNNSVYGKFFNASTKTSPNWFGFDRTGELRSRWSFQKHIISKDSRYVEGATVLDNLINLGYDRIWDCGNLKFWNE